MSDPVRVPGESLLTYAERLIREAQAQGELDGIGGPDKRLPLTGLPLPEGWWAREKMKRERLSDIPDAMAIRAEAEALLASMERQTDERLVRERLEELNAKIRCINRTTVADPPTTLAPFDVDDAVHRWREKRQSKAPRRTTR